VPTRLERAHVPHPQPIWAGNESMGITRVNWPTQYSITIYTNCWDFTSAEGTIGSAICT